LGQEWQTASNTNEIQIVFHGFLTLSDSATSDLLTTLNRFANNTQPPGRVKSKGAIITPLFMVASCNVASAERFSLL